MGTGICQDPSDVRGCRSLPVTISDPGHSTGPGLVWSSTCSVAGRNARASAHNIRGVVDGSEVGA